MVCRHLLPAIVWGGVLLACGSAAAQTPAEYYDQNCAGCHTIGQGSAAGPDLKDVTRRRDREWLIRFLLDPDDFRSEPAVAQMIKEAGGLEMPTAEGLTREMAIALLQIIEQRSASASAYSPTTSEQPFTPADVARGRDLFTGRTRLTAAGAACVQCHDVATLAVPGGGRVGPDLTRVTGRLGGARGVAAWLGTMPTPMMRAGYGRAPLTPEESRALTAFVEDAARRAEVPVQSRMMTLVASSLGMTAITLGVIGLLGARRFRRVRGPLVARRAGRPLAPGGSG